MYFQHTDKFLLKSFVKQNSHRKTEISSTKTQ